MTQGDLDITVYAVAIPSNTDALGLLRKQGFVVLPDVFDDTTAKSLASVLDRLTADEAPLPANCFEGETNLKVMNLLAKDKVFEQPPVTPRVFELAEAFLGEGLLLSTISSLYVAPGEAAQPLHSDDQSIIVNRDSRYPTVCTTVWALDHLTEANGTTRILAGSHTLPDRLPWRTNSTIDPSQTTPVNLPKGSVLVFDGACYHGAGENRSQSVRRALTVSYCAGFIRPVENLTFGLSSSKAIRFDRRLQQLCGYIPFRGMHGHVDRSSPLDRLSTRGVEY